MNGKYGGQRAYIRIIVDSRSATTNSRSGDRALGIGSEVEKTTVRRIVGALVGLAGLLLVLEPGAVTDLLTAYATDALGGTRVDIAEGR